MKNPIFFLLILLTFTAVSFADIAQPEKPKRPGKSIDTSLSIRLDRDAKEARLIIPRSQLQQLRAELDQIDGDTSVAASLGGVQTIVSGVLLSLAFVFGGLWFMRSGATSSKAVAGVAIVMAVGSVASFVYGNAGPPPEARTISGKMFSQSVHIYKQGWGKIKLEVSNEATSPELIVPDPPDKTAE
jgi:hypothetical protein